MKHISILVLDGVTLTSLDTTRQLFIKVNDFLEAKGKRPLFKVELVGCLKETPIQEGLYLIRADKLLRDVVETDLIIIPQLCGSFPKLIRQNARFVPWIMEKYQNGAEIASLCAGAFLLASTGLLKGQSCVVHWASAHEFGKMFPDVRVEDSKIITHNRGIYTSGGNYSYLNLLLYLIEKISGREMCVFVSKMFEIDIERKTQAPFMIFCGQKDHDDEIVRQAQDFIERNYRDKITIESLASSLQVGRRNLERRFRKVTSNSLLEYIQRVKVEAVKKGLETTRKSIVELMMDVDYLDIKSFRDIFKKITGLSPAEYKKKYGMESSALVLSH
jgi:transcriptional regulator GlxA family with amidase domain